MSWRTEGHYQGLSVNDQAWLKKFNSRWDKKIEGRSFTDAMQLAISCGFEKRDEHTSRADERVLIEALLIQAALVIESCTLPRDTSRGWLIRLTTKQGQLIRARFESRESALQAYYAVKEFTFWFQAS